MNDTTGRMVLDNLNGVARHCNATYDAVNNRSATVEEVRAGVTLMRRQLDRIEEHLVRDAVLTSVKA